MYKYLPLVALIGLAACDDDPSAPSTDGRVRVVNAIADVGGADVYVGTTKATANLAYKAAASHALEAGAWTLKVRAKDETSDLVSVTQSVAANASYTLAAFGSKAQPKSLVLTDDQSAPASGKAKVRVAHVAAGQPNVDVYVVKAQADLATATAVATNLASGAASSYATVNADTYYVILATAGTRTAVLTVPSVTLTNGTARTVFAVEKAGGGTPLDAVTLVDRQ